jgi:hypothetical protein
MLAETRTRVRRTLPILVLLLVAALTVVRWTGSVAGAQWRDSLDERLADAGAGTNAAMVDTERDHLAALRGFAFTSGFAKALDELDVGTIEQLLSPVDANLGVPMVDVLDTSGRVIVAFRGERQVSPIYRDRADLGIVQRSLRGEPDEYGERFTTLVVSDEGALIASAGAVKLDDRVVGAIMVMTPVADVLTESTNRHGALLTVYSGDGGAALATTAPVKPRTLPTSLQDSLSEDSPTASSYGIPGGTSREQLGALIVRHETVAWLGVAERDRSGRISTHISLLTAAAILICCLLTVAATVRWRHVPRARHDATPEVRRPIPALPEAQTERITVRTGVGQPRW